MFLSVLLCKGKNFIGYCKGIALYYRSKCEVRHDREVIRGKSAMVLVGDSPIVIHPDIGRHPDVVDRLIREVTQIKVVKCAGGAIGLCLADRPRVAEQPCLAEDPYRLLIGTGIEVTGEDHRLSPIKQGTDTAQQEVRGLTSRLLTDMVVVDIEEIQRLAAEPITEVSPATYAEALRGIPAVRRHLGCLRQPEVTLIQQVEAVGPVKDGRVLTGLLTIITPYPDVVIVIKGINIPQLLQVALLGAEEVKAVVTDQVGDHLATVCPAIITIVVIDVPEVEASHSQGMCCLLRKRVPSDEEGGDQEEHRK